ncbi:MAG: mannose-1-phosphate guanyltransferase [Calditerrivibrio nitroreducens]|uniref:Mannose-1-phosphate guanyltransferase n=1 Tax=Calditerrivibrio nitroreducens TaxID=477976 RepID=A0A2J6WNA7_9BACT|nr:MAG: mannose-1-phosphate guanyltransferase [Calditerrivibrio nitroreducens]
MKAVIMAGGFGTRIQPLTTSLPKPMIPVLNVPMMEYILESIKKAGITDIVILLYFMPDIIKNHFGDGKKFGVNINYILPDDDYGTAGAVKQGERFLDDDFIVISGDLVTDFDLNEVIGFHYTKGGQATICLTSVEDPLQFGVVITDKDGKIVRFLEKPGWGEVFSDTINTGIYVFKKDVLKFIPEKSNFDFSKDLFPSMMNKGIELFGFNARGYWRDVGNPNSYREVFLDIFNGKVKLPIKGKNVHDSIFIGENSFYEGAQLDGFVVLGDNVLINTDAKIKNCSIGNNVEIGRSTTIENSIIWDNVKIGANCIIKNAVLCNGVIVGRGVHIQSGGIVAENTEIGNYVVFEKDIMVWPNKQIEEDSILSSNLIWGDKWKKSIFEGGIVSAQTNVELSPELCAKLGAALGSSLPKDSIIILSRDYHSASRMLKRAFLGGLLSTGVNAVDLRMTANPVTKYIQKISKNAISVIFRQSLTNSLYTEIQFSDINGLPIDSNFEKNIERTFFRENFRRASYDDIGKIIEVHDIESSYIKHLLHNIDVDSFKRNKFKVVVDLMNGTTTHILPNILMELGVEAVVLNAYQNEKQLSKNFKVVQDKLEEIKKILLTLKANIGFAIFQNGERLQVVSDDGEIISPEKLTLIIISLLDMVATEKVKVYLPIMVPTVLDGKTKNVDIIRGRSTGLKAEFLKEFNFIGSISLMLSFPQYTLSPDAMFNSIKVMELLAKTNKKLSEVSKSIPEYHFAHLIINCPFSKKGYIMRKMSEDAMDKEASYVDGVKINFKNKGYVLMIPDQYSANVHLYVEAVDEQAKNELLEEYKQKITTWTEE